MKLVTAPNRPPTVGFFEKWSGASLFLAGSIEMGQARDWQQEVIDHYVGCEGLTIFNPRRSNWDPSWSQSPDNPKLIEQIDWELEMLDEADFVFFYLQAGTMSPITMLELGREIVTGPDRVVVVCEPGFWREANIHRTCLRDEVEVLPNIGAGLAQLDMLLNV